MSNGSNTNKANSDASAVWPINRVCSDRPSISVRTVSSPASPQSPTFIDFIRPGDLNMLTPPSSPPPRAGSSNDLRIDYKSLESPRSSAEAWRPFTYTDDGIISCPYDVDYVTDHNGQKQLFGYGAWSSVFRGTCRLKHLDIYGMATPPSRPTPTPPLLVAIKCPARKDAVTILHHEAQTLSRLRELDMNEQYVAAFHGIIAKDSSIVLTAHPLSMEEHIKSCAKSAQAAKTTANMSSPVIGGAAVWLDLADKLITTLEWMHTEAAVVHGDIKPGNILLRPVTEAKADDTQFNFQPLFIDFSSSQRLDNAEVTPNTLSAITKEYTAPELLTVAVLKDPASCATTASDVFSLAVTLLVAATGDPMVYTGYSAMQRQMLSTQGWGVLNNVRSLSTRVPRQGVVSRVLERAVLKKDLGRISTSSWRDLVTNMKSDMEGNSKL